MGELLLVPSPRPGRVIVGQFQVKFLRFDEADYFLDFLCETIKLTNFKHYSPHLSDFFEFWDHFFSSIFKIFLILNIYEKHNVQQLFALLELILEHNNFLKLKIFLKI